jgi:CheY-like chemotaxis protein
MAPVDKPRRPAARGRLFVFHWNEAECQAHAKARAAEGWAVETESSDGARGGKRVVQNPPDAVLVYLTRLPSHGRETAHAIRAYKATRTVPIVFAGGEGEALDKVKAKVPDGIFTTLDGLSATLRALKPPARARKP